MHHVLDCLRFQLKRQMGTPGYISTSTVLRISRIHQDLLYPRKGFGVMPCPSQKLVRILATVHCSPFSEISGAQTKIVVNSRQASCRVSPYVVAPNSIQHCKLIYHSARGG